MGPSLTDVLLQEACAERSDAMLVELGSDTSIKVPKSTDIVAYFVLDGKITIDVDEMENPIVIDRGEYGLLLYGNEHRIRVADRKSSRHSRTIGEWPVGDEPPVLRLGKGIPGAKYISAALRIVHTPVSVQFLHPLPELLHLERRKQMSLSGIALLSDMEEIDMACRGPGGNAFVNAFMNLHLFQALRQGWRQVGDAMPLVSPSDVYRSPVVRPIAVAIRLLRLHPERCWTVAGLARELGMSRSSLAANFRSYVGTGPIEYLSNVRMTKAAELLQLRHDLSLYAVAKRVGYDHVSSFSRVFKAHFGISPGAFSSSEREMVDRAVLNTAGEAKTGVPSKRSHLPRGGGNPLPACFRRV